MSNRNYALAALIASMSSGTTLNRSPHDAVVSHLEDGSGIVLVDGDDALGILHTGLVLDGAGDTQSNVDLGMDGLAGLADLMVSSQPASIARHGEHRRRRPEHLSQLFGQLDAALDILADTAANGNDESAPIRSPAS